MFTYGELLLIHDALSKLPKNLTLADKNSSVKFEPILISELKEKVKQLGEEIEKAQG